MKLALPYILLKKSLFESMILISIDQKQVKIIVNNSLLKDEFLAVEVLTKKKNYYEICFPGCVVGGEQKMKISPAHNLFTIS